MSEFRAKYTAASDLHNSFVESWDGKVQRTWGNTISDERVSYIEYWVPGDGPCHMRKIESSLTPFQGFRPLGYSYYYPDWGIDLVSYEGITKSPELLQMESIESNFTKLLAKTNPAAPSVSIPNFIHEMKDIPKMIRLDGLRAMENGRRVPIQNRFGNAYLFGSFGLAPVINDLYTMTQLGKSIDKTMSRLKRAHGERGASGKMTFGTKTATLTRENDNLVEGRGDRVSTASYTRYGSCRWKSTSAVPSDPVAMRKFAIASQLGLTQPFSTMWEAMPWSWFIDWFGNIGDFVQAHNNQLWCEPSNIWDHHKYVYNTRDDNVKPHMGSEPWRSTLKPGQGNATLTDYFRFSNSGISLEASLPILNDGQVRTATALILQRVRAPR